MKFVWFKEHKKLSIAGAVFLIIVFAQSLGSHQSNVKANVTSKSTSTIGTATTSTSNTSVSTDRSSTSSPVASPVAQDSSNSRKTSSGSSTTIAPAKSVVASTTTTDSGPRTSFGDGNWVVGQQIAPGTYQTQGGSNCYWQRESSLSGSFSSVISNDTVSGPDIVTILPSDVGFESQGCGTWHPLPASGTKLSSFGDGVYAVGVNISPGTYSTSGGSNCYWEMDSDFLGSTSSIISNNTVSGPVTLTIGSNVVGFKTQGCGTWSLS